MMRQKLVVPALQSFQHRKSTRASPLLMLQARLVRELPVLADYASGTAHFN